MPWLNVGLLIMRRICYNYWSLLSEFLMSDGHPLCVRVDRAKQSNVDLLFVFWFSLTPPVLTGLVLQPHLSL